MQKYTVKLLLKKNKKNKAGQYPIYLRITINRQTSFISTGRFIAPKMWDEKAEQVREAHPLAGEINTDILNRKKEAMQGLIHAGVKGKSVSAATIKKEAKGADRANFFAFADQHIKSVKNKRGESTIVKYEQHLRKLQAYHGSRQLTFEEITHEYLSDLEAWLHDNIKGWKGDSSNTVGSILKTIRVLFNAARKKGVTTAYPFGAYEMPDYTEGEKDYLSLAELDLWEAYQPPKVLRQAHIWFLFGCYTGLRVSDWHQFKMEHVRGDEIRLRAMKNGELVAIPIHARLQRVLSKLVPLTDGVNKLNDKLKTIAKNIGIDKHLSSHCGRKTFAVTMCIERGIRSEMAAEMMGITLAVFVASYSKVTAQMIKAEAAKAWKDL